MSELHMYNFYFFIYAPARFHDVQSQFVVFASAAVAHGIIVFMKKSIFYVQAYIPKFWCYFIYK